MFSSYGMFETNKGKIVSQELKQNVEGISVFFDSSYIVIQKKIHSYMGHNRSSTDFLVINRLT
jgi:hypothetical protein